MKISASRAGSFVAGFMLAASPLSSQSSSLPVSLGADAVTVSSVTPGGSVALLFAQHTPAGFSTRVEAGKATVDDLDSDGTVRFELGEPIAASSLWIAVDLVTGRFGAASPVEGAPFGFAEPLGRTVNPAGGSMPAADGPSSLRFLLVRRGTGIWHTVAADGGVAENTGVADGRTALIAPAWEQVAGAQADPGPIEPSDLLVAMDSSALALDAQVFGALHELP